MKMAYCGWRDGYPNW